ncbi:hypothetical protein Brms1b_007583 [Colletotrichum noveboracense]|nr:hypothetical protein Brms1b_007583 [Colletotrichum noveboracense]
MAYPDNVGIKAMEIYIPGQALDQSLFEQYQGVSAGKYTIGLGLKYMNFCNDCEVSSLLKNYNIDPKSIGRLEVGTESLINKAKSIKTVLTQLFEPAGNTSLEVTRRPRGKVPAELHKLSYEDSLKSKELEKLFVTLSKNRFKSLKAYGAKSFEPSGSIEHMAPGTYYLKEIDESYRRTYVVKE